MENSVHLASGQHLLLEPVFYWTIQSSNEPPSKVILTASIQSGPNPPIFPALSATTVAFQMDTRVAIELYEKLGELGRKMGWLPPI